MTDIKPGTRVRIVEDCRRDGHATGQLGTYEGDRPRTVLYRSRSGRIYQYDHARFMAGEVRDGRTRQPLRAVGTEWTEGSPEPDPPCWFAVPNPAIRLMDGTVIWGDECWWGEIPDGPEAFIQAQSELARRKARLRALLGLPPEDVPSGEARVGPKKRERNAPFARPFFEDADWPDEG